MLKFKVKQHTKSPERCSQSNFLHFHSSKVDYNLRCMLQLLRGIIWKWNSGTWREHKLLSGEPEMLLIFISQFLPVLPFIKEGLHGLKDIFWLFCSHWNKLKLSVLFCSSEVTWVPNVLLYTLNFSFNLKGNTKQCAFHYITFNFRKNTPKSPYIGDAQQQ